MYLNEGAVPISLGGDHAITLGELRAIYKKHGKVALVHFDSHLDLCDTVFGQKYNHGTPFRRAMEEGLIDPSHSIQIGMRGSLYDPDDFKIAADLGFKVIPGDELHTMTPVELAKAIKDRVGDMKYSLLLILTLLTRHMLQVLVLRRLEALLLLKHCST